MKFSTKKVLFDCLNIFFDINLNEGKADLLGDLLDIIPICLGIIIPIKDLILQLEPGPIKGNFKEVLDKIPSSNI